VFFLCPVTDISATVALIGVKFCTMVHIGLRQVFSPFEGGTPRGAPESEILGLNFGRLIPNISKTVSRNVTCQLKLDEGFLKCKSWAVYPSGRDPPRMAGCLADALFNFWWSVVWLVGRTLLS